jgi:hypothetical protein
MARWHSLLPQAGEGVGMRGYALQQKFVNKYSTTLTLTLSRLREREYIVFTSV